MQSLLCMIGLHRLRNWEQYYKVRIVSGHNQQFTEGYVYYYKATCACCGYVKHKTQTVR